jgi:hypothetical protein
MQLQKKEYWKRFFICVTQFFFCPALQPGVDLGLLDDQPPLVPISRPLCNTITWHKYRVFVSLLVCNSRRDVPVSRNDAVLSRCVTFVKMTCVCVKTYKIISVNQTRKSAHAITWTSSMRQQNRSAHYLGTPENCCLSQKVMTITRYVITTYYYNTKR